MCFNRSITHTGTSCQRAYLFKNVWFWVSLGFFIYKLNMYSFVKSFFFLLCYVCIYALLCVLTCNSFLHYLYQCMCHTVTSKLMDEKGKPIIQCWSLPSVCWFVMNRKISMHVHSSNILHTHYRTSLILGWTIHFILIKHTFCIHTTVFTKVTWLCTW